MVGSVETILHKNGHIEFLCLAVLLWMICSYCKVINTRERTYCNKKFVYELRPVVCENSHRDSIRDEPMIREDICSEHGCYLRRGNILSQFRIWSSSSKYFLVALCFFRKGLMVSIAAKSSG